MKILKKMRKQQDMYSHSESESLLSTGRHAITLYTLSHEDDTFISV